MASPFIAARFISITSIAPRNERAVPISPMVVKLTEQEDEICTLLHDFCISRKEKKPDEEVVVCRIAGGWVRDKLLGVDSHDLDIAINTMTGEAFAQELVNAGKIQSAGTTIASNPEQSKHLATTRLKIFGVEVDLVNLRSETYTKESRIPNIEFGTPLEDAERRDLTINALFYNASTREVEDFTGKGIDDLKIGRVRTPLEPRTTFEDDPLRVLRCVRFASRLAFTIDEDISKAAKDPLIKSALATKISRERIGEEMDKIIRGPDPLYAIHLLHDFDLLSSIFLPSPQAIGYSALDHLEWDDSVKGLASLEYLLRGSLSSSMPAVHPKLCETSLSDKSMRARMALASALLPFRGMKYTVKKKQLLVVESAIREGLKLGSQHHYLDGIPQLFAAADMIKEGLPRLLESTSRSEIGCFLRQPIIHNHITGAEWSSSLLFSLVQELLDDWEEGSMNESKTRQRIEKYNRLIERVEDLNLAEGIVATPILDGTTICHTLGIRPGPHMRNIIEHVVIWQLENPDLGVEECKAALQDAAGKGAFGELPENLDSSIVNADRRKKRKIGDDSVAPT